MECVKTVRDFALKNALDLERFMMFKTGIRDSDTIRETIQEFYIKLIETRALETYDPTKGTFKTYIMNLFCWLFPVLANRNHRAKYTFVSCVKDRDHTGQWDGGYTDIFEDVATSGYGPYIGNVIDGAYAPSNVQREEETEANISMEEFIGHIKRMHTSKLTKRIVPYIEYRNCGCNGADVAHILGVSNNMVKRIKERAKLSYEQWRGEKMEPGRRAKQLTREQVVDEIRNVQDLLTRYNAGELTLPAGFSYKEAVLRLKYLRNRQSQLSKKRSKPSCD